MTRGVTPVAHQIYDLHMLMFWICVAIGVGVFGYLLVAMIFHRKSLGREAAQFHENVYAEIAWTVVPFLLLIGMAVPATNTLIKLYDASEAELHIKVTGLQWKWQYEYLNSAPEPEGDQRFENVRFISTLSTPRDQINNLEAKSQTYLQEVDNPLVIPTNTKVRFLVTAKDVIHSWWVPQFAIKRDAIPGYTVEAWATVEEPGIFRGECAELCGKDHAFMPVVVEAVSPEEFDTWLQSKRDEVKTVALLKEKVYEMDDAMVEGKQVYDRACAACHGVDGKGIGTFPAMVGSEIVTNDLPKHLDIVVNGVAGTAMQAFGSQLNAAELAAVITYERNAFGNDTGDLVQPIEVYNFSNPQSNNGGAN